MKCTDVCRHGSCNLRVVLVIFGGFLIHLAVGGSYVIGNFGPYFISYLRNRTDDTTVRNVDTLWVSSLGGVGGMFGISVGGLLAHRFGPRVAILTGSIIFSTSVAMGYFAVSHSYIMVVFSYGFATTFGAKVTYGTTLQTAIKWLPGHATLAAGLIASGTGLSALIFNPVVTMFINPENLLPDYTDEDDEKYFTEPDLLDRVPMCFVILGSSYFVLQFIGVLCIADPQEPSRQVRVWQENSEKQTLLPKYTYMPDEDDSLRSENTGTYISTGSFTSQYDESFKTDYGESQSLIGTANTDVDKVTYNTGTETVEHIQPSKVLMSSQTVQGQAGKYTPAENSDELSICGAIKFALTSRSFYIIWLTCFLLPAGMQFFVGLYKAYGQTFIYDDHFLTWVGTFAAVFNCVGRPIWGLLMDTAGYRITLCCISFGFAVITGTIFLTEQVAREWFLVWICTIYLFYSGIWAMMPSALAKLLGAKNMAISYGLISSGLCLATLLGSTLASTLKTEIGWHGLFFLTSGMSGVVFISSFFFNGVGRDGKRI